jgi:hypothetical protein
MVDHYQALAENASSFTAVNRVKLVMAKMVGMGHDPLEKNDDDSFTKAERKELMAAAKETTWANTTKLFRTGRMGYDFLNLYQLVDNMAQRCK